MKLYILSCMIFTALLILGCNPMSESTPDSLCTGVHNNDVGGICHGSNNSDPEGYCSEANCHGPDIRGGNTGGPSCYACHGPYWEVRQHTKSIFGVRHFQDVCLASDFSSEMAPGCGNFYCHGADLTGGTGSMKGPGCDSCHGIPTADGSNCTITTTHTRSMDGARHHSEVCTSLASCRTTDCHGVSLEGGSTGAFPARACARSGCHEHTPTGPGCDD